MSKDSAAAGDATWSSQATSGDWNSAGNWSPVGVPTGTATFGSSPETSISFAPGSSATIAAIVFAPGASPFTLTFAAPAPNAAALTISGGGITNNSACHQQLTVASSAINYREAQLKFTNSASAGGPNMLYSAGPTTPADAGGGVIGFRDSSTAGAAVFVVTTGAGTPLEPSTVGGEVSFSESSSGGTARFTIFGSTSTTDGDTFGNVVFHDKATAANANFTNVGGTVAHGDGGNTQFYDSADAGNAVFLNQGASVAAANGGDVAFDGTATASQGHFHNHAASAAGGYGGVTSFNNNPPYLASTSDGASAGNGLFCNYGAKAAGQGGGHTFLTAKYGSPTAAKGTFVNYGSAVSGSDSLAGHTVLSISLPQKANYAPTAGAGAFWNFPGTASGAPGGNTSFAVYADNDAAVAGATSGGSNVPSAGTATFMNLGANVAGAMGGKTTFSGTSTAQNANLLATGGSNGGYGGKIVFYDQASGGAANVNLSGNGLLDLTHYGATNLTLNNLELSPGTIAMTLGGQTPRISLAGALVISASSAQFYFMAGAGFATNTPYTILSAPDLSKFSASQFSGNDLNGAAPTFAIVGNTVTVTFG